MPGRPSTTQPHSSSPSCMTRWCREVQSGLCGCCLDSARSSAFDPQDPGSQDVLNVRASFSPQSIGAIAWKATVSGTTVMTLYHQIGNTINNSFFFAYLTNWALIVSVLFHLLSCFNSLVPVAQPRSNVVSVRVKMTWILFAVGAHSQLVVTLLFWGILYPHGDVDNLSLGSVLLHGGVLVLVLIEGLVVNNIPVRLPHWFRFVVPFDLLYLVWTVLHSVLDIGNPDQQDEDPTTNDDSIYSVIDWTGDTEQTGLFVGVLMGLVSPIFYLFLWCLSLYTPPFSFDGSRRRYLDSDENNHDKHYSRMQIP